MPPRAVIASPLSTWFATEAAVRLFRRRRLGRAPTVIPPRDGAWRTLAPDFASCLAVAASGVPVQVAAERRYDRAPDADALATAVAAGGTIYLPQAHQILPRVTRLMVALRAAFLGPFREECSFLFIVDGKGREGMGLHHDGDVDAFWVQLEGERTVTLGAPVPPGTPEDLELPRPGRGGWRTIVLETGTLFHLPPRTPHAVVCHGRSLALSLTWKSLDPRHAVDALLDTVRGRARHARPLAGLATYRALVRRSIRSAATATSGAVAEAYAAGLTAWDVVSGQVDALPSPTPDRLWAQVPAMPGAIGRTRRAFPLWTAESVVWLPARVRTLARGLPMMPVFTGLPRRDVRELVEHGILAPHDLPLRIVPADPGQLDGWRFG
ncbi:MAG TPA: cupin domain-containing protein [Methylomirabilota bacterium]